MKTEQHTTRNGHKIDAFEGDFISKKIREEGIYEKLTLDYLKGFFEKKSSKPIVFDVGANIGNHALDFSTYAEQVYCFEPLDFVFEVLQKNISQNNLKNVNANHIALSDKEGSETSHIVEDNIGASGFHEKKDNARKVTVNTIIGDDYVTRQKVERIDLMKIDVEGHEAEVLAGLKQTIDKLKPVILMEWTDEYSTKKIKERGLLEWLESRYLIYVLENNHSRKYWKNKPFGKLKRRLNKWFKPKHAVLGDFKSDCIYHNIVLIPK